MPEILVKHKQYYDENKPEILVQKKQYRELNKELINKKCKCICGGKFTTHNKVTHEKTSKQTQTTIY